jgi:hypothetical protein
MPPAEGPPISAGAEALAEKEAEPVTDGVGLPLWQLQLAAAVAAVLLLLSTLWLARRSKRLARWTPKQ